MAIVTDLYEQIPVDDEAALTSHFGAEVRKAITERAEWESRLERAYRLYEGLRDPKNFPWKDCSNIHVPLVAIHGSAIHARFMSTIFGSDPFWRVRSKNPLFQELSTALTEYLDWARQNEFDLYEPIRDFAWDAIKYGLGILKATWRHREGPYLNYDYNERTKQYEIHSRQEVIEDRPFVESIPPHRFVWPQGARSVQEASWVAHILRYDPIEIAALHKSGYLPRIGAEKLLATAGIIVDRIDDVKAEMEGIIPSSREGIELYEVWARWPVRNQPDAEVQLIFEPNTGFLCRYNLNPYFHRQRPFVIGRLETREHSITGIGVADQIGDLNDEINTVHNQTIDASTISIIQMFGARAGTETYDALKDIYPGKRIPMTTPDDIKEIGLGPLKVVSQPLEEMARITSERRTGISDFGLGREPNPSRRGTATGTLAIIQEGNKKFDYQIRDMREALGDLGGMVVSMLQQNNPGGISQEVLGPDGEALSTINVIFPGEPMSKAVSVEVVASSASINRQVQRQDALSLFQLLMVYYDRAYAFAEKVAMLGQTTHPQAAAGLGQLAVEMARGAKIAFKEVLNAFEKRETGEISLHLEELYAQLTATGIVAGLTGQSGMGGAAPTPEGEGASGTPGIPSGAAQPPSAGISTPGPNVPGEIGGVGGGTAPA